MPVTMDYAAKNVLEEATKLLEIGWCQRKWGYTENNITYYCSLGALIRAQGNLGYGYGSGPLYIASEKLSKIVGRVHEGGWLSKWNDESMRTKEEVLEAFRKAQEI
jgi:hypothetical protein